MRVSAYSRTGLGHIDLNIPADSNLEMVLGEVRRFYTKKYGADVMITTDYLCSTPQEEGTWAHDVAVIARCDHDLTYRVSTVSVITNRSTR